MSGPTHRMTQCHIQEDLNPQRHRCENLKPHNMKHSVVTMDSPKFQRTSFFYYLFKELSIINGRAFQCTLLKGGYTLVTLPHTVTSHRDSVDGTRDYVTYVSKVRYAVTLRACSVRCRYLAVASKG
jgi:hypothetical protein